MMGGWGTRGGVLTRIESGRARRERRGVGLLYRALASGQVDMVAGNWTDGPIRAVGFVALEDDLHYFPPYEAVPLVREDSLRRHPGIQVAMDRLAGRVSAEEVRGMNYAVDSEHRDVGDLVREFRKGKGL